MKLFEERSRSEQDEILHLFSITDEQQAAQHIEGLKKKDLLDTIFSDHDYGDSPDQATLLGACIYHYPFLKKRYFLDITPTTAAAIALTKVGEPLSVRRLRSRGSDNPYEQDIAEIVSSAFRSKNRSLLLVALDVADGMETIHVSESSKRYFLEYFRNSWEFITHNNDSPELAFRILHALKLPIDNDILTTFIQAGGLQGAEWALKQGVKGHSGNPLLVDPYSDSGYSNVEKHRKSRQTALAAIDNNEMVAMFAKYGITTSEVKQNKAGQEYNVWDTVFSRVDYIEQLRTKCGDEELHYMRRLIEDCNTPLILSGGMDPLKAVILSLDEPAYSKAALKALEYLLPKYTKEMITPEHIRILIPRCNNDKMIEALDRFIELGVDLSPYLPEAGQSGNAKVVSRIIKQNPSINIDTPDKDGNTALMGACASTNFQLALGLLGLGANPSSTNKEGESAGVFFKKGIQRLADTNSEYDGPYYYRTIDYQLAKSLVRHGDNPKLFENILNDKGARLDSALYRHRGSMLGRFGRWVRSPDRHTIPHREDLLQGEQHTPAPVPEATIASTPVELSPAMQASLRETEQLDREIAALETAFKGERRQKPPGTQRPSNPRRNARGFNSVQHVIETSDSPHTLTATGRLLDGVISRSAERVENAADKLSANISDPQKLIPRTQGRPIEETHTARLHQEQEAPAKSNYLIN